MSEILTRVDYERELENLNEGWPTRGTAPPYVKRAGERLLAHDAALRERAENPPPELIDKWWKNELHDFEMVVDHLTRTYDYFSDGRISKPNTLPEEVFAVANDLESKRTEDAIKEATDKAEAECDWLRGMIAYARGAPDLASAVSILTDALDGVTGADNVQEVRGEREIPRAERDRLREAIEKAPHGTVCGTRDFYGNPTGQPCDCWKAAALAGGEEKP